MVFHKTDGLYLDDCPLSMGVKSVDNMPHTVAAVVLVGKENWGCCADIF